MPDEQVPEPQTLTESSGDGAGHPPRKTALGYFGSEVDDGNDIRKQEQWIREHLLEQDRQVRSGEVKEEHVDSQRAEFLRRWRERYPLPAGSLEK